MKHYFNFASTEAISPIQVYTKKPINTALYLHRHTQTTYYYDIYADKMRTNRPKFMRTTCGQVRYKRKTATQEQNPTWLFYLHPMFYPVVFLGSLGIIPACHATYQVACDAPDALEGHYL